MSPGIVYEKGMKTFSLALLLPAKGKDDGTGGAIPHYDFFVGAKESKTTKRFSYFPLHVNC
jgi:hypothetical protein